MTETKPNGNGVWKFLAVAVLSAFLGMAVRAFQEPKDTVTEKELQTQVLILQNKIDAQSNQLAAMQQSMNQTNYDVAQIAAKVGATAHPLVAPNPSH